jgi:hypothetical protein
MQNAKNGALWNRPTCGWKVTKGHFSIVSTTTNRGVHQFAVTLALISSFLICDLRRWSNGVNSCDGEFEHPQIDVHVPQLNHVI